VSKIFSPFIVISKRPDVFKVEEKTMSSIRQETQQPSSSVARRALSAAFRGGAAGFVAMILQVISLIWLRTVVNYQYRNKVGIWDTFSILYQEGGIGRFYRGVSFALCMGPISRFGDTAANEGIKHFFEGSSVKVEIVTLCASSAAAFWRILLTPLDLLKTNMQVWGSAGLHRTLDRARIHGIGTLYSGALGNYISNIVGHYSWFFVNNKLEMVLPKTFATKNTRRALIGMCSALSSDIISNGIRVIKTYKQTSETPLTYSEVISELFLDSGFNFVFRGLQMKLISSILSSILFSIVWKSVMDRLKHKQAEKKD
jgi:hypothetical protein